MALPLMRDGAADMALLMALSTDVMVLLLCAGCVLT